MRSAEGSRFSLVPETGVQIINGETVAKSLPVWLRVDPAAPIRPDSWVRLRYRSSFFDDNVRPLIRFSDGVNEGLVQPMNGTLFGVGEWIGYIPENTSTVSISPVARTGPFDFQIERVDYISPMMLFLRGALTNPRWIGWMLQTQMIGASEEARRALKLASTPTAFAGYNRWRRRLSRPVELEGIDRLRSDWSKTPKLRLFISVGSSTSRSLQPTVQSLRAQLNSFWSLHYRIDEDCPPEQQAEIRRQLCVDARIFEITNATDLTRIAADYSENDVCALITAGDVLPDYALAVVAETLARHPMAAAIYGDEDSISASGALHSPMLRPDWSPYFQAARHYIWRLICLRAGALLRGSCVKAAKFISAHDEVVATVLADTAKDSVHHVRRVLYRRGRELADERKDREAIVSARPRLGANSLALYPDVAVVVLTRDNADCLAECIRGLTAITDYPNLRITLVDNGSTEPKAVALLRDLKRYPQIDVLERPGPFNFAALCNEAARASQAPMLVFLNDDIAMRDRRWLKPLVSWAIRPDVGVAGAKLLFPNGRIQHAGVTIGLGGIAAHDYHGQDPRQAGYLERLQMAHEVEAVTAACIAIERKKFDAVGGFDASNLPVDLNDIDLCLRLAERGLTTVWTPESVLIHRESETRGRTPWSSELYRAERAYFVARWQAAIRDDRYFHPDLSLFSYNPALA
jgi:O-antigen biosynthesis protein